MKRYYPEEPLGFISLESFLIAKVTVEALKKANSSLTYKNFLDQIKYHTRNAIEGIPLKYNNTELLNKTYLFQYKDNKFVELKYDKKTKFKLKIFSKLLSTFFKYFDTLSFSYKTYFLSFIIAGGMIIIILLSQISVYTLKNDFDILFTKRTKPIIQLENIKDTYKINIYDTFYDIQHKNIAINESRDILSLGQQLINKSWKNYKENSLTNIKRSNISIY